MKKRSILIVFLMALMLLAFSSVKADDGGESRGSIRIDPPLPVGLESPATFEIWVEKGGDPTTDPHILLVMTEDCYNGLTGDVVVEWNAQISFSSFTAASTGNVPPSGTDEGARYTVASLRSHLGVPSSENIYYAYGPFLDGPLTGTHQTFTVTLPSDAPRMLVYAIGKTDDDGSFDNKVPPTIPGFVVPEVATIILAVASFSALMLYTVKSKRHH